MRARRLQWIAVGMALVIIHVLLLVLSRAFSHDAVPLTYPVLSFVALEMLAGLIYMSLVWLIPRSREERRLVVLVVIAGVIMRAVTMFSTPILEDDYYRYLWDGVVVAAGHDPYHYSPAQVLDAVDDAGVVADLTALSLLASHGQVARINYPQLTSIYPPLTQAVFALSAAIEPFSLDAWRLMLLLFEAATVCLLYLILRRLRRSILWLAIYLWNPLVVKELVNSAHMDALLLPFLAAALLLMLHARGRLASLALALAAAIKLWPVLLLPTVLRPLVSRPGKLAAALAMFVAAFSATAWWIFRQSGGDTGLSAYALGWNMNDAVFLALDWLVEQVLELLDNPWIDSGSVARALAAATAVWLAFWLNRRVAVDADALCRRFAILTAVVFLLSPAQFPWYYTWLVPFLVLVPSAGLLLLTVMLPLYYVRFYLDFRGQSQLFDYWIVWIEYLPVWLLLAREWRPTMGRRARLEPGHP